MTDTFSIQDSLLSFSSGTMGQLRAAVQTADAWDIVYRPGTSSTFPVRVAAARRNLAHLEKELAAGAANPAFNELRENPRLLRSALITVSANPKIVAQLPRVVLPNKEEEPRAASVASLYWNAVDGTFTPQTFSAFIRELQTHEPLLLNELWNIAGFLRFVLLELLIAEAHSPSADNSSAAPSRLPALIKSLRSIGNVDWVPLIEPLIAFDATLAKDPAGTYTQMDFESREFLRKRVAFLAYHSDLTETEVAEAALDLARSAAARPTPEPRIQTRRAHVGFYLIGKGFLQLAARSGYQPPILERLRAFIRSQADFVYITGIQLATIVFIALLIMPPLPGLTWFDCSIVAALLLLPASQCALDLSNNALMAIFDPNPIPKLDFSKGIPAGCTTLVAVPTLLLHEKQVRELVKDLEVRYLANRDRHLHFGLLTDLADSITKPRDRDSDPLVELAIQLIDSLNAKYGAAGRGGFLLLHRHRIFNSRQGVWMGFERKRGKLLDLNKLLAGEFDAFPIKAGRIDVLPQVRYVLTLDSDTQLPRGSAAKLIGAIAHPLNQAIVDPVSRTVKDGYGILQPRVGVAVQSASRSRLASIYSGQSGFDVYSRAVSDVYQDLYGEGIFTGKGIYEVATLHAVLNHRFPRNALLSHDLIEGAYARAGLTTDIELIDDYPTHVSAYNRRKHRWVRGDWQIAQWMFSHVPEESGRWVANPISYVSRWKIFDNLRRSLVEPFTFILFIAGWLGLPGGPLYWTLVSSFLMVFPSLVLLCFGLGRAILSGRKGGIAQVFHAFWQSLLMAAISLVFLPHQTLLAIDAIVRSLVRRFITGQRLLEWETAAQSESHAGKRTPVDRYLAITPMLALGIGVVVYLAHPHLRTLLIAAPILALWGSAILVTVWLNARPREEHKRLSANDEEFLMRHALRVWRYFHQFGGASHNYLIPDNVEEDGLFEAARVSPTNLGLLLNARQAACELGFLTAPELLHLTHASFATIARLPKFRGHLYNWYDTRTLSPLPHPSVSSVDSGNLVASYHMLHAGLLDVLKRPLLSRQLFVGLRTYWQVIQEAHGDLLPLLAPPSSQAPVAEWLAWLNAAAEAVPQLPVAGDAWWANEFKHRIAAIQTLVSDYLPWLQTGLAPQQPQQDAELSLEAALAFCESQTSPTTPLSMSEDLQHRLALAKDNLRALNEGLRSAAAQAERLAQETEFGFLVDGGRQLLSIGWDIDSSRLHEACYDLLASEARMATFLAVSRDELPQQSWFKLGRDHTEAYGHMLLLSWTGTMFEYLMPALWMRTFPDTLIAQTQAACVEVQRAFARSVGVPWGISESGLARKDEAGHYHYQAFGVPAVALKFDAIAGPVVSPYSTFLALGVDSVSALRNLYRLSAEGWTGAYGFYEALDFSETGSPAPVREWMAHHQGMSLLAVLNLLRDNIAQQWFHSSPQIQSAELLLHELPVSKAVLRAELKEMGDIKKAPVPPQAAAAHA